jgi:hypothetical protein
MCGLVLWYSKVEKIEQVSRFAIALRRGVAKVHGQIFGSRRGGP